MNKRGFTIIELLISILLLSIVLLLLLKVMASLEVVNHDMSYASDDEISRTKIIKNIEESMIHNHLNGLFIESNEEKTIIHLQMDNKKTIEVTNKAIIFDNEKYQLKSKNATYDRCIKYQYVDLENNYYLVTFTISVLIDNKNTTIHDDLTFTYMGLKNDTTSYMKDYSC